MLADNFNDIAIRECHHYSINIIKTTPTTLVIIDIPDMMEFVPTYE